MNYLLLAQTNDGIPTLPSPAEGIGAQFYINLATPFIAPALTAFVKWVLPKIPKLYIPAIAVSLGVVVNLSLSFMIAGDPSIWKAVALGLAGIGVRELQNQLSKAIDAGAIKPPAPGD